MEANCSLKTVGSLLLNLMDWLRRVTISTPPFLSDFYLRCICGVRVATSQVVDRAA